MSADRDRFDKDLGELIRDADPLRGVELPALATPAEIRARGEGVHIHHIPEPSNGWGPWKAFCGLWMPEDCGMRPEGPVKICETCGNAFKTWRRARLN